MQANTVQLPSAALAYEKYGDGEVNLVIEIGLGASMAEWRQLATKLAERYTVLLYQRAGYGASSTSTLERTPENIAAELYLLLRQVGHDRKVTVLAHSQGCLYAWKFAKLYPDLMDELFAFLGINGAGKSTTINIMCGQLSKDSGTVQIGGVDLDRDPDSIKRNLGVVFQNSVLDKDLSVQDNLQSRAALYGIQGKTFRERLAVLAGLLEFEDLLKRSVGKLSGDLRKNEGMTVFLTTHYMEEAADADYVVILDSGRIAAEGTPLELKNTYTGDFITLYGVVEAQIKQLGAPYETIRDTHRVSVPNTAAATELILKFPDIFRDYEITKGKMDDVFLAVTGKKLIGGAGK